MVELASLVGVALVSILGAFGWGWSRGTLHESDQERVDREFDRIVRRFGASGDY